MKVLSLLLRNQIGRRGRADIRVASMKVLSLLLRNWLLGGFFLGPDVASMKVLSLLLRNQENTPATPQDVSLNESPELIAQEYQEGYEGYGACLPQ